MSADHTSPVLWVNLITPKPGKLDAFLTLQIEEQARLAGKVPGLRGNRLYRGLDDRTALGVAMFNLPQDHKSWTQSELFRDHLAKVGPLIEKAHGGYFAVVYAGGII